MGTRIAFAGGESILVTEDLEAVVSSLEGHTADTPALPAFTVDDKRVHVRPGAVVYVMEEL